MSFQADDAERAYLDRSNWAGGIKFIDGFLRSLRRRPGCFAQHGCDDIIHSIGGGSDAFRHYLAVAQNHETVGDVQQLFEKVTDVDHPNSEIAQTSDDIVQTIDLGGHAVTTSARQE